MASCVNSLTSKGKRRKPVTWKSVIALDFPSFEAVKEILSSFSSGRNLKVGMELYYTTGPEIVSYLKDLGHSVFWISSCMAPNTVKSAMKVLSQLELWIWPMLYCWRCRRWWRLRVKVKSSQIDRCNAAYQHQKLSAGFSKYSFSLQESGRFIMLRRQLKPRLDGVVCSSSGSATHQNGYQSRIYLSDTGHSSSGSSCWRSNAWWRQQMLSNQMMTIS